MNCARRARTVLLYLSASNNAFASCKSAVSNPSVNQLYTGASKSRASAPFPCPCHSRARLVAARSSQDLTSAKTALHPLFLSVEAGQVDLLKLPLAVFLHIVFLVVSPALKVARR